MMMMTNIKLYLFIILNLFVLWQTPVYCDTWITLWNKLSVPIEVKCFRDGSAKVRRFPRKIVEPDDRYDIKGKYPKQASSSFYRHWCQVRVPEMDNISIQFDVFGGKNKKINKMTDSYSDWIINTGGIYRFRKGILTLYYGKNWLGEENNIENDLAGTPEKELHPEDFVFIQPIDVHLVTFKIPRKYQRYAISKAQYAAHKFENFKDMERYVKAAMVKKFDGHWEAFVRLKKHQFDRIYSDKTVKQTCDDKNIMNFSINEVLFVICKVMR